MRVLVLSIVALEAKVGAATVTRGLLEQWRSEWADRAPLEIRVIAGAVPSVGTVRARRVVSVVRGAIARRPSKLIFQETASTLSAARAACAEGPWDLLVVNGADMLGVARRVFGRSAPPLWVVVHNIETQLFREQLEAYPVWIRRLFRADLERLDAEETAGFTAADRLICICREDRELIQGLYPGLRAEIVVAPIRFSGTPYCERAAAPQRSRGATVRLAMLGNFAWWPNARGLVWFHQHVWPRLSETFELHLFGRRSVEAARGLGPRIQGWGECESLDEVWMRTDIMICPVRHGGGVRIKNAEAIWNGVPLMTNRLGMRGITDRPRAAVIVRESAEDWVDSLRDLASRLRSPPDASPDPTPLSRSPTP